MRTPIGAPVTIEPGEADTSEGCDRICRRISARMTAVNQSVMAHRVHARLDEELHRLAELESEMDLLTSVRAAVKQRKDALWHANDDNRYATFVAAVLERFGQDVIEELRRRAKEIGDERRRRHEQQLTGNVIPVGTIRGVRQRRARG